MLASLRKISGEQVPAKIHWRIYLDLADNAKREAKFIEARLFFKLAIVTQPFAYQGWLEYSKMEEESGNQDACLDLLLKGLKFNPFSENLFTKIVKIEEKRQNFSKIRQMVDQMKARDETTIDNSWKILMEGALFEGRCGNRVQAREQFSYLLKKCNHYGQIYLEASKYEERENQLMHAIDICEEGLDYNASYNPLWFQYLRLYEKVDSTTRQKRFDKLHQIIDDMYSHINKEFHWKVSVEIS